MNHRNILVYDLHVRCNAMRQDVGAVGRSAVGEGERPHRLAGDLHEPDRRVLGLDQSRCRVPHHERAHRDQRGRRHEVTDGDGRVPEQRSQDGRAHDVPNLFVADGGPFVSQADKNPTWTIMALAWRASDYIMQQRSAGTL